MSSVLSTAEELKFSLLSDGITLSEGAMAHIRAANGDRPLTPADYATTSGIILGLDDDVWVNVPIATYNPNFVDAPRHTLTADGDQLIVAGDGRESPASFWLSPAYHGASNGDGEPYNSYAFTHGDRVRVSPVEGCAFTCKFCDLPYEFRYRTKRLEGLVDAVKTALADPLQPAQHILISGGTPRPEDFHYVRDSYEVIIGSFPGISVDVMMVPYDELLDASWLGSIGVGELSVNVEIFNRAIARRLMRRKFDQGLDHYLGFLQRAAEVLGANRVRSMLLVGIEPMEDTLAGVAAIAERGCVPVLSPFRPDGSTPLHSHPPPTAAFLREAYLRARDITTRLGSPLGPSCIVCSHNTLTLAGEGSGDAFIRHGNVRVA